MHFILVISGFVGGLAVGLIGVGFTLIILPVLFYVFLFTLPADLAIKMAVATTLAGALFSVSIASILNFKEKNINFQLFLAMTSIFVITAILGPLVINYLPVKSVEIVTSIILLFIAARSFFIFKNRSQDNHFSKIQFTTMVIIAGLINSMCGIGTSNITIPYLSRYYPMQVAKSTALMSTVVACAIGTISYMINGWHIKNLPLYSLGYVYLPAFFLVSLGAIIATPLGIYLSKRINVFWLRYILLTLVMLAAIDILKQAI